MTKLKEKIKLLYPKEADKVHKKLLKIIDDFKKQNPKLTKRAKRSFFSEKDVMLICYADHVKEPGVKTLKTMHKFLHKYAKGIINKIHFLPFYSHSEYDDCFAVKDYYKIHEPYGDWNDMKKINQDFDFMFDFVLNHASLQGVWPKKQLAGDKNYKNFYHILDKQVDVTQVFRPRTHPLLTPVESYTGTKYAWTTFTEDQVDWNYGNPKILPEIIKILLFYFEQGAKAIRLDAVAYIWKDLTTSCFDQPQCHTLVQIFRDVFREVDPHAWAIAETVLPHERNIEYLGDGHNESHFVYNFALETLLMHTFLTGDSTVAANFLNNISNDFGNETSILNLTVSHDGVHVIPARGILNEKQMMAIAKDCERKGGQVLYRTVEGKEGKTEPYELNITYPSAIEGVKKYLASQAIQMALKGVPLIYLNNLIGAENWTEGVKKLGNARAINRQKFDYRTLVRELNNSKSKKHKIYNGYKKLLKTRINEPLFSPLAEQKMLELDSKLVAILRFKNNNKLLALTNVTDKKAKLSAQSIKSHLQKDRVTDIITNHRINLNNELVLLPYQTMWLK